MPIILKFSLRCLFTKRKIFYILLLLILIFNNNLFSFSKLVKPKYNFGNHQNPEIDKLYPHLQGRNIYFISEEPERTLFIIIIYPENNLRIGLKMYTNSENLINALNSGKKLFFGVDLLINNTDISLIDYSTDIVICYFDLSDSNCNDYIFDLNDGNYKININGSISNNNLIPINFESVELNLLKENVMEYKNYYCVDFIKNYTKNFDNYYMLNYFFYSATQMGRSIIGFYGIVDSVEELNIIPKDKIFFYKEVPFMDGIGLPNDSFDFYKISFFKYIFIILIIINIL